MKKLTLLISTLLSMTILANGQGLLSVGQSGSFDDFDSKLPFTATITGDLGFDSNVGNRPDGFEEESGYIRGGVGAAYRLPGAPARSPDVALITCPRCSQLPDIAAAIQTTYAGLLFLLAIHAGNSSVPVVEICQSEAFA